LEKGEAAMSGNKRKSVWLVCVLFVIVSVAGVAAQQRGKAPKKKPARARRVSSAFFCPKCSADGAKALYPRRPKGGKCPACGERLVKGRLIWYCQKCDKLNFRSAKCTKCGKESKPVVVRWSCTKCKWGGAAPRKRCPKCKSETKREILDNLTKYCCPKCKYMSAEAGECPACKVQLEPKEAAVPAKKPAAKS